MRSRLAALAVTAPILVAPLPSVAATLDGVDLKDVGSVAAIVISLVALLATQITTSQKTQREQREELKEAIEKLLDMRLELNAKSGTFSSQGEREFFGSMLNNRRSIYLEWAERLAKQLPYVTPAEWIALGNEHMSDSDYGRAKKTFERAMKAARGSSAVSQAIAQRLFAYALMMMGKPNWPAARHNYKAAAKLMDGHADPYSRYTAALTYRYWGEAELSAGNMAEGRARLGEALAECGAMPDWFNDKAAEVRNCASDLMGLSDALATAGAIPGAREALVAAEQAMLGLSDPFSIPTLAWVLVRRAKLESQRKEAAPAAEYAERARALISSLPVQDPQRNDLIKALAAVPVVAPTEGASADHARQQAGEQVGEAGLS